MGLCTGTPCAECIGCPENEFACAMSHIGVIGSGTCEWNPVSGSLIGTNGNFSGLGVLSKFVAFDPRDSTGFWYEISPDEVDAAIQMYGTPSGGTHGNGVSNRWGSVGWQRTGSGNNVVITLADSFVYSYEISTPAPPLLRAEYLVEDYYLDEDCKAWTLFRQKFLIDGVSVHDSPMSKYHVRQSDDQFLELQLLHIRPFGQSLPWSVDSATTIGLLV